MFSEILSPCNPDWQVIVQLTVNGILAGLALYYARGSKHAAEKAANGAMGEDSADSPRTHKKAP